MTRALLLLLAVACLLAGVSRADNLDPAAWDKLGARAEKLMATPGEADEKERAAAELGADDSLRATKTLVRWSLESERRQSGEYLQEHQKREEEFRKLEALLLKAYKTMPPTNADHLGSWTTARNLHVAALNVYSAETRAQGAVSKALRETRAPAAVAWLAGEGLKTVRASKNGAGATLAIITCLLDRERGADTATVTEWAGPKSVPEIRALAVEWLGRNRPTAAMPFVLEALADKVTMVRRAAVVALGAMDDPSAVKPLIDALATSTGLLADEIDAALHGFTGQTFDGDAKIWLRWWDDKGAAWLARASKKSERWDPADRRGGGVGADFYGIVTRSERIVFVVDRSGSMKKKAPPASKPREGPVTGGSNKEEPPVQGDTNMDLAKNQLARSIDGLGPKVTFNVIFYGSDVQLWKPPPALLPARPTEKDEAKKWFGGIGADGSTQLFAALTRALDFAVPEGKGGGGADTIYLLSDGSPTGPDGKPLPEDAIDRQVRAFLDANHATRCVVHTIGIGTEQNRPLMERLARETGGKYVAVGAE